MSLLIDNPVKAITLLFDNMLLGTVRLDGQIAYQLQCGDQYQWLSTKFIEWKKDTLLTAAEYDTAFEYFLSGRIYGWIIGIMNGSES